MSQLVPEPNGATPPDPAASAAGGTGDGGTQTPDGFVPKADFERAEAQRRETQRQLDLTKNELAKATTPAPVATPDAGGADFDPVTFRRQILNEVAQANAVQAAAVQLQTEFPHADPSLFGARLAEFGSPDALRLAAEASHARVAAVVAAADAATEARLRAEFAAAHGGGSGSPSGGTPGTPGDPTPAQLAAMTIPEMEALEAKNPGVLDRVMRSAI